MLLIVAASGCLAQLKKAEAARTGVEEAQALDALRKDISDRASKIKDLASRATLLRSEKVELTRWSEIEKVKQVVANIAARFQEKQNSTTLKQGKRWKELIETLDLAIKSVSGAQLDDWKAFHSTRLFAGLPPLQIKATVAPTPGNSKLLDVYNNLYLKFSSFKNAVPSTSEVIQEVKRYSKELEKIKFDMDVPDEVAKFFEATGSSTGASLDLLTDAVLKWLRSNKLLGNYVARARLD